MSEVNPIEAMARAHWQHGEEMLAWDDMPAEMKALCCSEMVAALTSLSENITVEMGLAGAAEVNKQMRGPGPGADYHAAVDAFRAMLDQAMKEHER